MWAQTRYSDCSHHAAWHGTRCTVARRVTGPKPHLHRDRRHICTGTEATSASAPGPVPHLHRDRRQICTRTEATSAPGPEPHLREKPHAHAWHAWHALARPIAGFVPRSPASGQFSERVRRTAVRMETMDYLHLYLGVCICKSTCICTCKSICICISICLPVCLPI